MLSHHPHVFSTGGRFFLKIGFALALLGVLFARPSATDANKTELPTTATYQLFEFIPQLMTPHSYRNSVSWQLGGNGVEVEGERLELEAEYWPILYQIWDDYGDLILKWSSYYEVPAELVVATIGVESKGNPKARNRIHTGLMQVAPATARYVLEDPTIDRQALYNAETVIQAGTAYIAYQSPRTQYDPPLVAAAYNAGDLIYSNYKRNPWKLRHTRGHLTKFVRWFNAAYRMFLEMDEAPPHSFARYFEHPFCYGLAEAGACDFADGEQLEALLRQREPGQVANPVEHFKFQVDFPMDLDARNLTQNNM